MYVCMYALASCGLRPGQTLFYGLYTVPYSSTTATRQRAPDPCTDRVDATRPMDVLMESCIFQLFLYSQNAARRKSKPNETINDDDGVGIRSAM